MPETDRAAPKRALRRVGSSRNNSLTRGVLPQTLTPRALSPKLQSRASTRNKYVLREEKEREEEEGRRDETSESIVQSAADRGVLVQSDSAMFRSRGYLADKDKADDSQGRSRLRMTMVDGVNSMGRSRKTLPLAERECIPTDQVIDILESLSSTLIFNSANKEEKLALASRLRHWVVEDGTYLIREGDGDRNRSAIFVIASGKATISLNRTLEDDTVQEADIKDIKSPNYFGEGRVLGDSRAYASVRAKEELVVYYIMRADVEEIVSPTTRSMMVRDMHIRKFQKENLDDLFAVIREKPSGLACLKRFADEQLMGGDVGFFIDVEAYKKTEAKGDERMQHAQRIVDTYISPTTGGPGLIYTSEAQRKALAAKMKRLWGRPSIKKDSQERSDAALLVGKMGSSPSSPEDENNAKSEDKDARGDGAGADGDGRETALVQGDAENAVAEGPGGGDGSSVDGGDRSGDASGVILPPAQGLDDGKQSQRSDSDASCAWSGSDHSSMENDAEHPEEREEAQLALTLSLFDEILDQNAIPTIRQNIVPKFIQSSYYELFLAELFPLTAEQGDKEKDSDSRGGALIASLEAIRHNPEAVAERIAEAVAAAKAAAEAEAIAAAEAEEAAKLAARAEGVEGNRQQADGEGQPGILDGEPASHPRSAAGSGEEDRSHRESLPGAGDTAHNAWCGTSLKGIEPEFSDEPLFIPGCRDEGVASRIYRRGLYGIDAASNVCALM